VRAWANEILWAAQLSPYQLSTQVDSEETERLAGAIRDELARGLELRLAGANDATTYRVHNKLGAPCERCGTPLARVDFEEHTIYYCPTCQTGGRHAEGPPDVTVAQVRLGLLVARRRGARRLRRIQAER